MDAEPQIQTSPENTQRNTGGNIVRSSNIIRRGTRRLLLAVTTVALVACQTVAQDEPVIPVFLAETQAPAVIMPPPPAVTLTPFQPSIPTEISPSVSIDDSVTMESPVVEQAMPVAVETLPQPDAPPVPEGIFTETNSYILRNPTEIMNTPERAAEVANQLLQRLIALGIVRDSGEPLIIRFKPYEDNGSGCETFKGTREIVCTDSPMSYQKPDASLVAHEVTHELQEGAEVKPLKELRAAVNAFLIAGKDPQILDRYLFALRYPVHGKEFQFTASDFVRAMEAQGVTDEQLLAYGFDDSAHTDIIIPAMIRWVSSLDDFSHDERFIVSKSYRDGANFPYELFDGFYGVNPYASAPGLTPETQFDMCRVNMYPAEQLMTLVGTYCSLTR